MTEADAIDALHAALDAGMTFIDTADVYGDGRSERLIAQALQGRSGVRPFVATKAGRRANPHVADAYTLENLTAWTDRSRRNLGVDTLDWSSCIARRRRCSTARGVRRAGDVAPPGAIAHWGVSVEKVEEG